MGVPLVTAGLVVGRSGQINYGIYTTDTELKAKRIAAWQRIKDLKSAFRLYDIRWQIYKHPGDIYCAYWMGRAFGSTLQVGQTVRVGYDSRESSPAMFKEMVDGLLDSGVNVEIIGMVTTGMAKWIGAMDRMTDGPKATIMTTGSHGHAGGENEVNGFKLIVDGEPFCGDMLQTVFQAIEQGEIRSISAGSRGQKTTKNIEVLYQRYLEFCGVLLGGEDKPLAGMHIAYDNGFGPGGGLFVAALRALGAEVVTYNMQPDGKELCSYVMDPAKPREPVLIFGQRVAQLNQTRPRDTKWIGIYGDPDKDRFGIIDEDGQPISPADSLLILMNDFADLKEILGEITVLDIRAPVSLWDFVDKLGKRREIVPAGYSFVLEGMRKTQARFGSELSTHFMTALAYNFVLSQLNEQFSNREGAEFRGVDDGFIAMLWSLAALQRVKGLPNEVTEAVYATHGLTRTEAIEERLFLPDEHNKFEITARVDARLRDTDLLVKVLQLAASERSIHQILYIDGTKVIFNEGEQLVGSLGSRVSNTGSQNCIIPEVRAGEKKWRDRQLAFWLLENFKAAQELGVNLEPILESGIGEHRYTTFRFDFDLLLTMAQQFPEEYATLIPILTQYSQSAAGNSPLRKIENLDKLPYPPIALDREFLDAITAASLGGRLSLSAVVEGTLISHERAWRGITLQQDLDRNFYVLAALAMLGTPIAFLTGHRSSQLNYLCADPLAQFFREVDSVAALSCSHFYANNGISSHTGGDPIASVSREYEFRPGYSQSFITAIYDALKKVLQSPMNGFFRKIIPTEAERQYVLGPVLEVGGQLFCWLNVPEDLRQVVVNAVIGNLPKETNKFIAVESGEGGTIRIDFTGCKGPTVPYQAIMHPFKRWFEENMQGRGLPSPTFLQTYPGRTYYPQGPCFELRGIVPSGSGVQISLMGVPSELRPAIIEDAVCHLPMAIRRHFVMRPGGQTSIDVGHQRASEGTAVEDFMRRTGSWYNIHLADHVNPANDRGAASVLELLNTLVLDVNYPERPLHPQAFPAALYLDTGELINGPAASRHWLTWLVALRAVHLIKAGDRSRVEQVLKLTDLTAKVAKLLSPS